MHQINFWTCWPCFFPRQYPHLNIHFKLSNEMSRIFLTRQLGMNIELRSCKKSGNFPQVSRSEIFICFGLLIWLMDNSAHNENEPPVKYSHFFSIRRLGPSIYHSPKKNISNFKHRKKYLKFWQRKNLSPILYLEL